MTLMLKKMKYDRTINLFKLLSSEASHHGCLQVLNEM